MGRLDRLELFNFKSYGGNVVVGPFKGFTAIIGTNGSGKSNLMDAISFVLGVRTAQLRGNQLRDLVYRNLEDPDDDPSKRRTHVKLVYRHADDPVTEVEFTRSVTLTGASEYRVRGRVVNLEAYNAELAAIGVLVKARNFLVFQNEVESIASKSPKELSVMFEEVSQSAEFREAYDEARAEKDAAEDAVTHFWRKRKGMAAEKRQYREQKEEMERFRQLQQQVAGTRTEMSLYELFHVDQDLGDVKEELTVLTDELEDQERQLGKRQTAFSTEKAALQKMDSDRAKLERRKKRFAEEIEKLRPMEVKLEAEKSALIRRLKADERSLERLKEDESKGASDLKTLEDELHECREAIKAVDEEIAEAEQANVSREGMAEYRTLKDTVANRTARLEQDLQEAKRNLNGAQNQRNALQSREAELRDRVASAARNGDSYRGKSRDLDKMLADTSTEVERLRHEESQLGEVGRERDQIRENLERTITETTQALRDAKADMTQNTREEAFNNAVERMKSLFEGVHGRLSDLCQPTQARYREAIAVLFGKLMDAVIVDTARTGTECIRYLKDQRVGVGTFIPLDDVRPRPVDESLRRLGGTSRLAIDVIKHREFVMNAVHYAAGNAVVCDTLEEARQLRYGSGRKIKICSLDGTLINKAGFMTGGASRGDANRARKWDRAEIENLRKKRYRAQEELQKQGASDVDRRTAAGLREKVDDLTRKLSILSSDRHEFQARALTADKDMEQSRVEVEGIEPQVQNAVRAYESAKSRVESIESELHGLENELFSGFLERYNLSSIQEFEEQVIGNANKIREKKLEMETKEHKLVTSIKYHKTKHGKSTAVKVQRKIETQQQRLSEVGTNLDDLGRKKTELDSRAAEIETQLSELVQKKQVASDTLAEKRQECRKDAEGVSETKKKVETKRSKMEQLQSQRKKLLTAAKVAQISIPTRDGEEMDEDEPGSGRVDTDGDVVMGTDPNGDGEGQPTMHVNVNVVIDYSQLSRKHRAAATVDKQREMLDRYAQKIKEMEEHLDGLAPNMKANEHMTDVNEKLNEIDREAEAARERARTAVAAFEDIKQKRQDRFNGCFRQVSGKIDEVYKELTKSTAYPMGGTAYLSLEQQDEPYLGGIKFNAMPPTKRFRDMDQLSGGERTVAALALLFAIHDFRPSPFFVLDEVDAALDNLNVGRVSSYVKSRAPELQTIVISLKDAFFERADALVGIYRDIDIQSSRLLTLDLNEFEDAPPSQPSQSQSKETVTVE